MKEEKNVSFSFMAFIYHKVEEKYWLFSDEKDYIKANFKVIDYTNLPAIKGFYFVLFINHPRTESIFLYKSKFGYKSGIFYLAGKIPYDIFKEADGKIVMRLMCESYLTKILDIPSLRGMKNKNFDAPKWLDDLKKVFQENKWI